MKKKLKPDNFTPVLLSGILMLFMPVSELYCETMSVEKSRDKKFEIETGIGLGNLGYYVDTAAGSLLRWRDSANFQQNIKLKYSFSDKLYGSMIFENYILSGGEMTDDDLNNLYGTNMGVYSTTRNMKGSGYRLDITGGCNFFTIGNIDFIGTAGFFIRKYEIKPKGILQVGFDGNEPRCWVYYDDQNVVHTEIIWKGLQVGTQILNNITDSAKFIFDINLTFPLAHESKQYYWGYKGPDYDWKLKQDTILKNRGIDLRIENRFRLSDFLWWGIYGYYSRMKSTDQDEIDWDGSSYKKVGTANSSVLSMAGAGVSLYFLF